MKLLKKLLPEIVVFPVLVVVFFFTRLYNIMSLPIFTDEAIYTRWSQIASQDANWRFISLTDGKQPLFVWIDMILMKFIHDPLLSGRLVSVGAGFLTAIGIYFLTTEIFKVDNKVLKSTRLIGIIAVSIIVLYPFSLVYDRMALYESMVAMFFVWALYLQILLVKHLRLDIAMVLGVVLGGAVLTKSSGFLSVYLTPFLLLLANLNKKNLKAKFLKFVLFFSVSIFIAYAMYSILRLSPFFHIINDKNSIFIYSFSDWLKFSFSIKVSNFVSSFNGLWDWFFVYFTLPYIILAVVSFFVSFKFLKEKIVLALWFLLPFLALCVFGKTLYPRYILFMTMPLIPLVAYTLFEISIKLKKRLLIVLLFVVVFALPLRADYYILKDFAKAPIPSSDLGQYINGWPSGGGVNESVSFFKKEAKKGPIYIVTQGTFGLMPYSYEIYLVNNPNITIKGLWPIEDMPPKEFVEISKKMPVYVVFYQPCPSCLQNGLAPSSWPLTLVATFKKGTGENFLTVYRIHSL